MSKASTTDDRQTDGDVFDEILEHEETAEKIAERDDRLGAIARYMLALAREEPPDDRDAEIAGLPKVEGGDGQ